MFYQMLKANLNYNGVISSIKHSELVQVGIKNLFLDVDGTLLPRSEKVIKEAVKDWVKEAKIHFRIHLISNNPSKKRIKDLANQLDLDFTYKAGKPSRKSIRECVASKQLNLLETGIIGDRIFTDILVGNRLGIYTILVKQIGSDGKPNKHNYMQTIEKKISAIIGRLKL